MWNEERPEIDDVEGIYRATAPVEGIVDNDLMDDDSRFVWQEVAIVVGADEHLGARGADLKLFKLRNEWIKGTSNAYLIELGDLFNNGIKPGQHPDSVRNQAMIRWTAEQLMPLVVKGKLLEIMKGNHDGCDGNRNVQSDLGPLEQLYDKITPYSVEKGKFLYDLVKLASYAAVTTFPIATPDARHLKLPFSMYTTHNPGTSGSPVSSIDSFDEKAQATLKAKKVNMKLSAHLHGPNINGVKVHQDVVCDENGRPVAVRKDSTLVVSAATSLRDAEYAKMMGLSPSDANVYIYVLRWKKNLKKGQDGDNRDFIVDCKIMPMFRKDSNEYTNFAIKYMNQHLEIDREQIRETYERMSTRKIETRLRNQVANHGTAKSLNSYLRTSPKTTNDEPAATLQTDDGRGK